MAIDLIANKAKFLEILRGEVKRDGIEKLITWLDSTDFYEAPATGKYTLSCKGGLVEHSLNTYKTLMLLVARYRDQNPNYLLDLEEGYSEEDREQALLELDESLAICALLHDICRADCWVEDVRNVKNNATNKWEAVPYFKWDEKFIYGHGEKSAYIIQQYMRLYVEEAQAIRYHSMGRDPLSNTIDSSFQLLYEVSPFASAVGLAIAEADYILDRISDEKLRS